MKIKLYLLSFLCFISFHAFSQMEVLKVIDPAYQPQGYNTDLYYRDYVPFDNGDLITSLRVESGSYLFDPANNSDSISRGSFLLKFDKKGNFLKSKRLNFSSGSGIISEIKTDSKGNLYGVILDCQGTWKFDSLSNDSIEVTSHDLFLVKYDSSLNYICNTIIQNKSIRGIWYFDKGEDPVIYIADYGTTDTITIAKFSSDLQQKKKEYKLLPTGTFAQTITFGEGNLLPNGDIIVKGYAFGTATIDLDPDPTVNSPFTSSAAMSSSQYFYVLYDSLMHVKKTISFNTNIDIAYSLFTGDQLYFSGNYTTSTVTYLVPGDFSTLLPSTPSGYNNFIAHFDNNLNFKWAKNIYCPGVYTTRVYPIRRRSGVNKKMPAVYSINSMPGIISDMNIDFTKFPGTVLFQLDSTGKSYYYGSHENEDFFAAMQLVVNDSTFLFDYGGWQETQNISFNPIPFIFKPVYHILDNHSKLVLYSAKSIKKGFVNGKIIADVNNNSLEDSTDYSLVFKPVINVSDSSYALSDINGNYSIATDTGNYDLRCPRFQWYSASNPFSYTGNIPSLNVTHSGKNFFHIPDFHIVDLAADISVNPFLRADFEKVFYLNIINKGTLSSPAKCTFHYDTTKMHFISTSILPLNNSGDSITWALPNLDPLHPQFIKLTLRSDSLIQPSDSLFFRFEAIPALQNDLNYLDNTDSIFLIVLGSYDPNDKRSDKPAVCNVNDVDSVFEFRYTINFQNTGNDTAFRVILIDTLDSNLDIGSLRNFHSSHPFSASLLYNHILRIEYQNILLPDSGKDMIESNGFFAFNIKPKSLVSEGTIIKNSAAIFFDFNEAVITNTTSTEFSNIVGIQEKSNSINFNLYPNPTNDFIIIDSKEKIQSLILTDQMGRILQSINSSEQKVRMQVNNLASGIYFISVQSKDGIRSTKKFIKY